MPYVNTRLGRLFYEERGQERGVSHRESEPVIVLLHGLLFDGGMWRGQVEPLSALGRVLVFDGPGHGKSDVPPAFTLEDHAEALFDAFGELGVKSAVLVGLSWGGMLAMRLALRHPRHVAGLALLDTSAEAEGFRATARYRAFIALHRAAGFPFGLFEKQVAPLMFGERSLRERRELLEASYRRTMGFDRDGVARAALAVVVNRTNILPKVREIRVPTLVLCGREDRSTTPDKSANMASAIPGASLVVLDGLGHMSALEDPEAVNEHLVPFVRDVVAGRSSAYPSR